MGTDVRGRLREMRNRWIDYTLVRTERARASLARGQADVLVLGESSCLAWAHHDTDRRLIPELIGERSGRSAVSVAGPGYDARMYAAVLRVLAMMPERPRAVVLAINIRTNTAAHVLHHPLHGHDRSRAALALVNPPLKHLRSVGTRGGVSREEAMARFRRLRVTTRWGGAATIGEYLARLEGQGPPPWPVELERLRFDYFHGEVVSDDNEGLVALRALRRGLVEYGVPVVAYWAQPPVVRGEELFPGEFTTHVEHNLARVETALDLPGAGFAPLLRPVLAAGDFQDERNGTEHYAFSGRTKVADAVARSVEDLS